MKNLNICELLGLTYIFAWTLYLASMIGKYPKYPTEAYDWKVAVFGVVSFIIPLFLGYLAGLWDRRRW